LIRVFTNESLVLVSHVKNILLEAGIVTVIKNERLAGALGEIPYLETWPELWVIQSAEAERARGLIKDAMADAPGGHSWICSECSETNESQFGACWRCQTSAPG
jgi:hypothetical protein